MKRMIVFIMSAILLLTMPAQIAFASESDALSGVLILADEAEMNEGSLELDTEEATEAAKTAEIVETNEVPEVVVAAEMTETLDAAEEISESPEAENSTETGKGTEAEDAAEADVPDLDETEGDSLLISVEEISQEDVPEGASEEASIAEEAKSGIQGSGTCGDNLLWTLDESGTLTISGTGEMYDYYMTSGISDLGEEWYGSDSPWFDLHEEIASVVIEAGVVSIGDYAFYKCENLTSVTIADSVKSVGGAAFRFCTSLVEISFGEGVTSIGGSAFAECVNLEKLIIGTGVTSIGASAFLECTNLISITLPDDLISIGNLAFSGCSSLMKIEIPDGVSQIGYSAFLGCSSLITADLSENLSSVPRGLFSGCSMLNELEIPAGVTSIDVSAFTGCSSLDEIEISADNSVYCSKDGVIYDKDGNTLVLCPPGKTGEFTVPDGVTTIGSYAFYGCTGLTNITLPDSISTIGQYAFAGCSSLTEITIPSKVTVLRKCVFSGCTSLAKVSLSSDVTDIRYCAFSGCTSLADITIPDGVTAIDMQAFAGSGLTSITIPAGVTSIGDGAFRNCTKLTSVTMNAQISSISKNCFNGCTTLSSFTVPDGVTTIGKGAFSNCTGLTCIFIPASVSDIKDGAFNGCTKLVDVYYGGSQTDWNAISTGSDDGEGNELLLAAVIHYNATSSTSVLSSCMISSLTNTSKGITIEWGEVSGSDGYYVYRKTNSGKYKKIKTIKSASTLTYTDTAVKDKNGVTYLYKVLPYVNGTKGTGKAQTIVRLTGTSITSVTNTASGKLKVKWTSVADITGYQVKVVSTTIKKKVSASKKSVTLTGTFTKGKTYYVCIRTYKKVDGVVYYSAWSSKTSVKITK